jgi:hypothetical protein
MHAHEWRLVRATKMIGQPPIVEYQCRICPDYRTFNTGEALALSREHVMPIIHKPKLGDIVEVTIKGVVTSTTEAGFHMRTDKLDDARFAQTYRNFYYEEPSLVGVTVTKRNRKIGDHVNRNELMAWDPTAGTVITQDSNDITWMKIARGLSQWVNSLGTYAEPSAMPGGDYRIEAIA